VHRPTGLRRTLEVPEPSLVEFSNPYRF